MAIEVPQNEEISGKEGEKESVLPCVGEERIGGSVQYILRKDSEEELFREMLTLT